MLTDFSRLVLRFRNALFFFAERQGVTDPLIKVTGRLFAFLILHQLILVDLCLSM